MPADELKARWRNGEVTYGATIRQGSTWVAEVMSHVGLDFVKIDLQHGMNYEHLLMPMFQAMNGSKTTPLVKVSSLDHDLIGRVIGYGAEGISVPEIETPEDAERAVNACRPFPEGRRSIGQYRLRYLPGGVRRETICLATIESALGVENVDAIAATEGIDGIVIRVKDLALSLGQHPTSNHAILPGAHADAVAEIQKACARQRVACGMTSDEGETELSGLGFQMISLGADTTFFERGLAEAMSRMKP